MDDASAALVVDARGVVTGWSEGARLLTGFSADEAVGRPLRDLLAVEPGGGDDPPGRPVVPVGVVTVRHRDGRPVTLRLAVCPVHGPGDADAGHVVTALPAGAEETTLAGRVFEQSSLPISVFDAEHRFIRLNAAAAEVMGGSEQDLIGRPFSEVAGQGAATRNVDRHMRTVTETGRPLRDESYSQAAAPGLQVWDVEMWPVRDATGRVVATALAGLDSTEQHRGRRRLALLDEAASALGTTLDVVRTAEELAALLVPAFADFAAVDLLDWVLDAEAPPPRGEPDVVMRRAAHASAGPGAPDTAVPCGRSDVYPPYSPPARALREGRAVLARTGEPDFDRWMAERGAQALRAYGTRPAGIHSELAVPLRARGTTLGVAIAVRNLRPDGFTSDDALLAEEITSRAALCVDNARRFARERATALTLQHSLLPQVLPGQAAVEIAHRYLPSASAAGVGGDWFDVIPLSGTRVALVVGDVVGHGIHSTATMGRLCTAVRTLADVDLPPEELLTHLDDLVVHLAADEREDVPELGATCLYAVYDPVSRQLAVAAAGHPAPALLMPDGTCRLVPLNTGPPLGVGGLPFEATELELPEGCVVALYTDGLLEGRDRDVDDATQELHHALRTPAESLDTLCDMVLKAVLPEEPGDDVALLLARTRALGAGQVATRDVGQHPEEVAAVRKWVVDLLSAWGLDDISFVTELVVSELVTNAIRYGEPPVRLRLIRDRTLICEVTDSSSTSPHLRRAHAFDEGGRGLLLVAQLTQRWGSRQADGGKTIWAEQALPRR
ncbi:SpoIIE family protein phosphatase [Streptomyces sp. DSM 41972]|uniref:SpoIIE family protein phosphatase n=1 Tax=Streptomyces althioticus subsp. attaecolombicae TaxID=3075534 RepID=A0ABU3I6Q2_9ACTN|nr:SpoIIE family protein phosphatase [Streptomyces sp. DSM 41972]SCD28649.1 PAS domain S-box-containing protein [Streptomyces sp. di50b]SCE04649.1 PAS domain S-box-containing protein [Streptomyces sp. di188]